jgi:hypothetical protein
MAQVFRPAKRFFLFLFSEFAFIPSHKAATANRVFNYSSQNCAICLNVERITRGFNFAAVLSLRLSVNGLTAELSIF